jgi:hypothetical protein
MSDPAPDLTKNAAGRTMHEHGLHSAKLSIARLARFAQLDAPVTILINELLILKRRLMLAAPEAYARSSLLEKMEHLKPMSGFCATVDCTRTLADDQMRIHGAVCPTCKTEDVFDDDDAEGEDVS